IALLSSWQHRWGSRSAASIAWQRRPALAHCSETLRPHLQERGRKTSKSDVQDCSSHLRVTGSDRVRHGHVLEVIQHVVNDLRLSSNHSVSSSFSSVRCAGSRFASRVSLRRNSYKRRTIMQLVFGKDCKASWIEDANLRMLSCSRVPLFRDAESQGG